MMALGVLPGRTPAQEEEQEPPAFVAAAESAGSELEMAQAGI